MERMLVVSTIVCDIKANVKLVLGAHEWLNIDADKYNAQA